MTEMKVFWMVWSAGGGAPTAMHPTYDAAANEAARLAAKHPGREFYVLQALSRTKTQPPAVETVVLVGG